MVRNVSLVSIAVVMVSVCLCGGSSVAFADTYTQADLAGQWGYWQYCHEHTGVDEIITGDITFDENGYYDFTVTSGDSSDGDETGGPLTVLADGRVDLEGSGIYGQFHPNKDLMTIYHREFDALPGPETPDNWEDLYDFFLKPSDASNIAAIVGTWAYTGYQLNAGVSEDETGTFTVAADGSATLVSNLETVSGTVEVVSPGVFRVAGVSDNPPVLYLGESGQTFFYIGDGADMGSYAVMTIPEPTTISLLALGGLALLRRRRAA